MDFDLNPDPRILPMLGEITLLQWRCLAELIDNSVDGFLHAKRRGDGIAMPEVWVSLPPGDHPAARVSVRDNGPGMTPETLARAVSAGWTGNSPIDSLGMFGMGFNIATARLGTRTTVWTCTASDTEEHGLVIDFEQLRRQRHFRTKHEVRPKTDPDKHGTEITVDQLKPEQSAWLSKAANRRQIRKELSVAYSAMLRENGLPISFKLYVNNERVLAHRHCVWDESRGVETARDGRVSAVVQIDRPLRDRPFCAACWQWVPWDETVCPTCDSAADVVIRKRHVRGWVGLQRYLGATDYGIDFIRNGRKIEMASKELFEWRDGESAEVEYPIDEMRPRGRFVGEIHIDHCRVTYTKDRFDRGDPAWEEMLHIVRGDGPLRPEKARQANFTGPNESPLYKLYQAFRRNTPQNPGMASVWKRLLIVPENTDAEQMARKFHEGVPEYQDDSKWMELVEEADNRLLLTGGGTGAGSRSGGGGRGGGSGGRGLFGSGPRGGLSTGLGISGPTGAVVAPAPPPVRSPIHSLTREYRHDGTNLRWQVLAFAVKPSDPGLGEPEIPWRLIRQNSGDYEFLVNPDHDVFRSATLTDKDALLWQLAEAVMDSSRRLEHVPSFARVIADLRDRYGGTLKLDPSALTSAANERLSQIARSWAPQVDQEDRAALFEDIQSSTKEAIYQRMAVRGVLNHREAVLQGRFLEYAQPSVILDFVVKHPELFFDGRCWDVPYSTVEYPQATATDEARRRVVRRFEALLADTVWLAEQPANELGAEPRARLLRAALAVDLLVLTATGGFGADSQ